MTTALAHELPLTTRSRHWPGVVAVALTATATVVPGFTVGALATAISADLAVSRGALGLAMSAFYAATALGSPLATRLAARLPVPAVLRLAALVASATMLVISQATGAAMLTAALVVGGLGNALVQPAAGRLIAARVPTHRRSLAAGVVGAALGAATLVPGLLVAFVLPAHGWRTAMLVAGLLALAPVVLAPLSRGEHRTEVSTAARREEGTTPPAIRRVLVLWAVAAALSATGNNAVASYFVQLGDHSGLSTAVTGNLLSLSALLAIAVRLVAGALTDRAPRHNPVVITAMMLLGAVGLGLVAVGTPGTFVLGAVLAFAAGWGWTGLLLATTLRLLPGRAASAGHTVQVGIYTGATVAPFAFGALSSALGFPGAALVAAVAALAGAISTVTGALLLRKAR
ncbi:MFS transporter [Streptoalloteichus hindustanus]|uniref:Predicted arabinose efflux permease, MFS family n=1 Tax=Streptoalloteichus hindustanus TaxID=2017 RepID=A0A1M5I847_STRHI|nr:MFS transporter [Streptoalloteichus hindustanus]SHG24445.1 Predicted arabinose efflux permease, MFS family [Streptoalloteichus hindustanus]